MDVAVLLIVQWMSSGFSITTEGRCKWSNQLPKIVLLGVTPRRICPSSYGGDGVM